jgi:hypothetical protein
MINVSCKKAKEVARASRIHEESPGRHLVLQSCSSPKQMTCDNKQTILQSTSLFCVCSGFMKSTLGIHLLPFKKEIVFQEAPIHFRNFPMHYDPFISISYIILISDYLKVILRGVFTG